jgi:hypothetical protein
LFQYRTAADLVGSETLHEQVFAAGEVKACASTVERGEGKPLRVEKQAVHIEDYALELPHRRRQAHDKSVGLRCHIAHVSIDAKETHAK